MNIKSVPKKQLWGIELNLISLLFSSISPVLNKFSLTSLSPVVCGIIAVSLTLLIAQILHQRGTLILVLAGIVISGFMQALVGLLKYIADPDSQLQSIVYWQLGSLAKVDFSNIIAVLPFLLVGTII